jgi:Ca2+-binding RTX toxin-like protein
VRSGIGGRLGATLLAAAMIAAAAAALPAGGTQRDTAVTSALERGPARGAAAAETTTIFVLAGTPADNVLNLAADEAGRLVITSPQGITEPDADSDDCRQDSPTQVSCEAGFIDALAGDLGAGDDTLVLQPSLRLLVGVSLVTQDRWMTAGPGADRISGGFEGDLIRGGAGADALLGYGGGDLVSGDAGRDTLAGGAASDKLLGGKGADKLRGGGARDLCNGGPGFDRAKSCNVARKIP